MNKWITTLALATGCMLGSCHQESREEQFARSAQELTARCPSQMDAYTTMDSVTYDNGEKLYTYYYTLRGASDSIFQGMLRNMVKNICANISNSPEMRTQRESKLSFRYVYRSAESGKELFDTVITPEDYE